MTQHTRSYNSNPAGGAGVNRRCPRQNMRRLYLLQLDRPLLNTFIVEYLPRPGESSQKASYCVHHRIHRHQSQSNKVL